MARAYHWTPSQVGGLTLYQIAAISLADNDGPDGDVKMPGRKEIEAWKKRRAMANEECQMPK